MDQDFCPDAFWDNSTAEINPNFTKCFKKTIPIWIPCLYLLILAPLDILLRYKNRFAKIPWTILNISKLLFLSLLICITIVDLSILFMNDNAVYPSQWVSVGLKIITFNDSVTWVDTNPNFTVCFKQTILIWIPCALLLVFSPLDIYLRYKSRYTAIPWSILNISKLLFVFLLICLTIIDLSMMLSLREENYVSIYISQFLSVSVKVATFILVAFLVVLHKKKGHVTSGLLFLFWLLLVVFAIPQLRWEIQTYDSENLNSWTQFQFINYITYFTLIVIMLLLSCFVDKKPQSATYIKTHSDNASPEQTSSFLNQIFFQWFTHTTWIGYRRPLTEKDIYDINPENMSRELVPPFDKYFAQSIEKGRRKQIKVKEKQKGDDINTDSTKRTNGSVTPAIIKAYGGPFLFAGFLQLIIVALLFAQPFLLDELITFTATETAPLWQGLLYTIALFIVTFLSAMINGQYFYRTSLVGFRIKTGLISAIYRKALRISIAAKKDTTVGEIVNLMSVDAQRFKDMINYFHDVWSGPVIMGVAIWLLYCIIGVAVFAGLAVMILMIPMSGVIYSRIEKLQVAQMAIKDERVKSMSEILTGMKVLKLYAWEPSFEKLVFDTREKELSVLKSTAIYNAGSYFSWTLTPFLVSLVSYVTFVLLGGELTPNIAFVSVTLFNILQFPMGIFPMMIAHIIQVFVSLKRINKFMNSEEIDPNNVTNNPSENSLSIEKGTFTWGGDNITLKDVNMTLKKGNLTALVGPVGCGKTSLISSLLGEMEKIKGNVNVDGRVAYVPQQAWIQNATLQDNILFGRTMKKQFYNEVVNACALQADLAMLPAGDQTEIGEKGINLSGGQKQRVALARAVYSEADIYLLDDPLSAVDSHVGKHIFDNVFGENGLLNGKSRLLVTHAVVYLPKVDEIFVMVNGEITESGSYRQLLAQKGAFAEFLTQHLQEIDDDEDLLAIQNSIEDKEVKRMLERSISKISSEKSSLNGSIMRRRRASTKVTEKSEKDVQEDKDKSKLIDVEEAASGSVGIAVYIRYFRSIGFALCILAVLSNGLNQAASVYSNIWLTYWSTDHRAIDLEDLTWRNIYMGVYGALGAAQGITVLITSMVFGIGCLRAARDLHNKLLHNVMRLAMSFFDTTPSGRIMNRFSTDINVIDNVLPMNMQFWVMMSFNVLGILVVISYSTPWFLVVIIPIAIVYYFIQVFFVATSRQLKRIESITLSPIYNHFSETITGQSLIRAYGEEKRFTSESESRVDHNQTMTYPSIIAARWLAVRLEVVGALVVLFACLFAVLARDTIDPATVGLSISYALQISQTLSFLVSLTAEVETNIVAIERVNEYSNRQQEAPWKTVEVNPTWPQNGVVRFENFQVRYREGLDLVLKGINFAVKSQEKIGIVGRTGAGKSSLTLALFRIIEAADGKIIIDDINVAEIGLHSLRARLTIIPQDPVLFSGSLRMNIDPFNSYSDDAIWIALEQSHLKSFVKTLSDGLDYKVAESGENLSVGQRQLVCLARALLRKTKVLILDEATAAIDIETDELIQKTIRTQFGDCTILTIAHRLNTIMDSDRVIVLDQGQIAEFDMPKVLLENKDSIFYGMAKNAGLVNSTIDEEIYENTFL